MIVSGEHNSGAFFFIFCGMHHLEFVAPSIDNSLQSVLFQAISIALFRERFFDFRCWCSVESRYTRTSQWSPPSRPGERLPRSS